MHKPVLLNEVIRLLDPKPGDFIIDGTINGGGYADAICDKILPNGKLLGIDWDEKILAGASKRMSDKNNVILKNDSYANLPSILEKLGLGRAHGLVLDLGFSTEQLEFSGKGFSFEKDEPLLMTYSDASTPVRDLLKGMLEEDLKLIISAFGEERYAARIAHAIKERTRKSSINTSKELKEIIEMAVPKNYERGRIHPATRTFQALRIYANKELENLENVLKNMPLILKNGGRAVIVSFHSLEDRLVKNYFRNYKKEGAAEILTKKPIIASQEEIKINPRSRSAKLRVIQML